MTHFFNVREMLQSLSIDASTGSALHTQSAHDEIVVVLEGDAEFQVGEERRVVSGRRP